MTSRNLIAVAATLSAAIVIATGAVQAAEIKVMGSAAFKEAYSELIPHFEKASGHKVTTSWVGTADIMKRIGGGEVVDLVIASAAAIDDLAKQGKLVSGSRLDIATSGVGVAVRAGAPKIDTRSGDSIKAALLAAKSIAYSSGPSGVYLAGLFQKWGIADAIKPKLTVTAPGIAVGDVVARGEAEIGFQQVSELLPVKGIDFLGPLPPDIQIVTTFSAGFHTAAASGDAAKALVKYLTSPEAAPVIKKSGMNPA
jgi:molybdate transport system substrate-binding protein